MMFQHQKRIARQLFHWVRMLMGKSYYHTPQGIGLAFDPERLHGYFNDLTGKAKWKGSLDADGMPVNKLADGTSCYFVTTIVQKALGHFDLHILTGDMHEKNKFLTICKWLADHQDMRGGWDVSDLLRLPEGLKYSAMPQGEATSALVRAWKLTGDMKYLRCAEKAFDLMMTPVENGGTAYYQNGTIYLEECPGPAKNTILNGWLFALFGIHDMHLATGNESHRKLFYRSSETLKKQLRKYDAGYWSYYDENGALASPFYHDLHINQLRALQRVSPDDVLAGFVDRWEKYRKNRMKKARAFSVKVFQKLRNPSPVVIVK